MTGYTEYHDVYVEEQDSEVRWVDHGEVRTLDPEQAEKFAEELMSAAIKAKAKND